jgi:hypothetical protein
MRAREEPIPAGTYSLLATVTLCTHCTPNFLIISIRFYHSMLERTHPALFNQKTDSLSWETLFRCETPKRVQPYTMTKHLLLQLISACTEHSDSKHNHPYTSIDAEGTVYENNSAENSFSVLVTQLITSVLTHSTISIHMFLITSPHMPNPTDLLPHPNEVVCFSGELLSVEIEDVLIIVDKLEIVAL